MQINRPNGSEQSRQSDLTTTTQQAIKDINFQLNLKSILYAQYINDIVKNIYQNNIYEYELDNNIIQYIPVNSIHTDSINTPLIPTITSFSTSESFQVSQPSQSYQSYNGIPTNSISKKKNTNQIDNLLYKLTRKSVHQIFLQQINQDIKLIELKSTDIQSFKIYTIQYLNQIFRKEIDIVVDNIKILNLDEQYFYTKIKRQSDIISVKNYYENVIKSLEIKLLENYLIILTNIDNIDINDDIHIDLLNDIFKDDKNISVDTPTPKSTTLSPAILPEKDINLNMKKENNVSKLFVKSILLNNSNINTKNNVNKVFVKSIIHNSNNDIIKKETVGTPELLEQIIEGGNLISKQKLIEHIYKLLFKLKMYTNYNYNNNSNDINTVINGGNGDNVVQNIEQVSLNVKQRQKNDLFMILSTYDFQKIQKIILYFANKYLDDNISHILNNLIKECEQYYYRIDKILYEYIKIRIYYLYNRALLNEYSNTTSTIVYQNNWLLNYTNQIELEYIKNISINTNDIYKELLTKVHYDKHKKYLLQYLLIEKSKTSSSNKLNIIELFIEFTKYDYNVLNQFQLCIDIHNSSNIYSGGKFKSNTNKIVIRLVYDNININIFADDFYQIVRTNSEWIIYNQLINKIKFIYNGTEHNIQHIYKEIIDYNIKLYDKYNTFIDVYKTFEIKELDLDSMLSYDNLNRFDNENEIQQRYETYNKYIVEIEQVRNRLYECNYVMNAMNMYDLYKCYLDNNYKSTETKIYDYILKKKYINERPCKRKYDNISSGGKFEIEGKVNIVKLVSPIQSISGHYDYYNIICNYFKNLPDVLYGFLNFNNTTINIGTEEHDIWKNILKFNIDNIDKTEIKKKHIRKFINSIPFNYLIVLCDLAHDFLPSGRATYKDKLLMSELKNIGFLFERFIYYNRPPIIQFFKQLKKATKRSYDKIQLSDPNYNSIRIEFEWCDTKDRNYWFSMLFEKSNKDDRHYKDILYMITKIFILSHQQFYSPYDSNKLLYQINPTIYPEDIDFKCIRGSRDINFLNGRNASNNNNYASIHFYNNRLPITDNIANYNGDTFITLQDKPNHNYYVILDNIEISKIISNMYQKSNPSITEYKLLHQTNHFLCIHYEDNNYIKEIDTYKNSIDIVSTKYHFDCLICIENIIIRDKDNIPSILPSGKNGIKLIPVYNITNGPNTIDPNVANSGNILKDNNDAAFKDNIYDINLNSLTLIPNDRVIFFVINYIAGTSNVDIDVSDSKNKNIFDNEIISVMNLKQAIIYSQDCFKNNKIVLAYFCANYNGHSFNGYCILGFNQTYKKSIMYIDDNDKYKIIKKSKFSKISKETIDYYRVDYLYVKYFVDDTEECDISNDIFIESTTNYKNERGLVLMNTRNTADGVNDIVKNIYKDLLADDSDNYVQLFKDRSISSKYYSLSFPITGGNVNYNTNDKIKVEGIQCSNPLNGNYFNSSEKKNNSVKLNDKFKINHLKNGNNVVNKLYNSDIYDIYKIYKSDGTNIESLNIYFTKTPINGITQYDNTIHQLRLFTGVDYDNTGTGTNTKFDYINTFEKFKQHIFQLTAFQLLFKTWGDLSNVLPSIIIFILSHLPNYKENFETTYLKNTSSSILIQNFNTFLEYLNNINVFTGDDTSAILLANIISGVSGVRVGEQNTDFSFIHMNREIERAISYINWKPRTGKKDISTFKNTFGYTGRDRITFMEDSFTFMKINGNSFDHLNLYEQTGINNTDFNLTNRVVINGVDDIIVGCSNNNILLYKRLTDDNFFVGTWLKNIIKQYKDYVSLMLTKFNEPGIKNNQLIKDKELDYSFIRNKNHNDTLINILHYGYSNPEKIQYNGNVCNINDIPTKIKENMYDLIRIHYYYYNYSGDKFIERLYTQSKGKSPKFDIKDTGLNENKDYIIFKKQSKKTEFITKTEFVTLLDFNDTDGSIEYKTSTIPLILYDKFKWHISR